MSSPPPIEPSPLPGFDPTRCPQPRRGHPRPSIHPFIHPSHPSQLTAPHRIPQPPHGCTPPRASPAPSWLPRVPPAPVPPYLSGAWPRTGQRSRAASSTERGQRLPRLSLLAGEEPGYSQPLVWVWVWCGRGGGCECVSVSVGVLVVSPSREPQAPRSRSIPTLQRCVLQQPWSLARSWYHKIIEWPGLEGA